MSVAELESHKTYWNAETVQEFWSGAAFHRPDEVAAMASTVARLMIGALWNDSDDFAQFLNEADYLDGGSAALHAVYRKSTNLAFFPLTGRRDLGCAPEAFAETYIRHGLDLPWDD